MASPLERASARRKIYYFGIIAILFTVTIIWRGVVNPFQGANWLERQTIEARATAMDMREVEQGQAELTGSAVRLTLTGSRGVALCALWIAAIEKQKKHEWNDLELLVNSITKLQPHFLTPWLFQSWNLAWNVSVEAERLADVYFYVTRGIQLLARGESINTDNPDMRYQLGFYNQNKFGVHDKVDTMRSLFVMSTIPPAERDPTRFWDPQTGEIREREFEEFVTKYPMLVRRLRESKDNQPTLVRRGDRMPESGLSLQSPEEIAEFLYSNRKIPSRFNDAGELLDRLEQFPVLPPAFDARYKDEPDPRTATDLGNEYDGFLAARAWYQYSLIPLPPPSGNPEAAPEDPASVYPYRIPRSPMLIIFRQGAPRAASYHAEWLEREGWFDGEGWEVDRYVDPRSRWFDTTAVVGRNPNPGWGNAAWDLAFRMWDEHGTQNGLVLSESRLSQLMNRAEILEERGIARMNENTPRMRSDQAADPTLVEAFEAHKLMQYYRQNREATNFTYFWRTSQAERDPRAIEARKRFFWARRAAKRADLSAAINLYDEGLDLWKQVLNQYPEYHRHQRTQEAQSEMFAWGLEYAGVLEDKYVRGTGREELMSVQQSAFEMLAAVSGAPLSALGSPGALEQLTGEPIDGVLVADPLSGYAADGRPWVLPEVVELERSRYNLGDDVSIMPRAEPRPN